VERVICGLQAVMIREDRDGSAARLLQAQALSRSFGGVRAVHDASFHVAEGTVTGVIGPNGAGKTTLINMITGYMQPDSGSIVFAGEEISRRRPNEILRRGIARTYQNLRLFEGASVLENVLMGRHRFFPAGVRGLFPGRRTRAAQRDVCLGLLRDLDIDHVAAQDVADMPYGVRRRVEIARALATEPRLLLLDEPVAGMSRAEADSIGELIVKLRGAGTTVVLVEHNVRLVSEVCESVTVLQFGKVIAQGSPRVIWADPRVRSAYLGTGTHAELWEPESEES
jgi:branched-chain amino acid transport system ATP-binding protein